MEVLSIKEQDDGSAIVELEMTQQENDILVEHAILDILRKQIERMSNEQGKIQSDDPLESEDN